MREIELSLGACDADVEEPALFLEQSGIVVRLRQREEPVLEATDEHDRELEPLRVVQRHERHRIRVGAELVELGDEHGALEEVVERRESHLPFLVGDRLRRTGDQLSHVLEAIRRLGSLGTQIFGVANGVDELTEKLVDRRLARRLAEARDQSGELEERTARRRTQRGDEIRADGRREHRHACTACRR